jgi:hypothetical protein
MSNKLDEIRKTNKCNCENPKWTIADKRIVKSGKQCGKIIYLIYCMNCKTQWATCAKYAKELDKNQIYNN